MSAVCHPLIRKAVEENTYVPACLCRRNTRIKLKRLVTQRMAEFRVKSKEEWEWGIWDK